MTKISRAVRFSVLAIFLAPLLANAGAINLSGTILQDDTILRFQYTVQNQGPVTVSTTSFAGGGFIPILSLFDATGTYVFGFDGYANNSDATMSWVSDAGADYVVVLTEYDNYPLGNYLDGFSREGQGNFTTDLTGFPGPFRDPSGAQLTGDWAITFSSADPLTAIMLPEPGTGAMMLGGLLAAIGCARRAARKAGR